jgi:2,4-dienoyl-CoA reductase-like NADH-dependent reductase (Old Yellow Enzyme family)
VTSTLPNDLIKEYYTQRASGGLLITEGAGISEDGSGWRNAPRITTEKHAEAWKSVVDSVHAANGVIFLQLWHMGRQAHSSHHPTTNRIVGPSAIAMEGVKAKTVDYQEGEAQVPHALTVDEVKATVEEFVNAARLASQAGSTAWSFTARTGTCSTSSSRAARTSGTTSTAAPRPTASGSCAKFWTASSRAARTRSIESG